MLLFHTVIHNYASIFTKKGWATFWAILSQTHLVTLVTIVPHQMRKWRNTRQEISFKKHFFSRLKLFWAHHSNSYVCCSLSCILLYIPLCMYILCMCFILLILLIHQSNVQKLDLRESPELKLGRLLLILPKVILLRIKYQLHRDPIQRSCVIKKQRHE
jgi:hypothetical protein